MDPLYGNLSDDELLTLAQSAGVLPSEQGEEIDMEGDPSLGERQDFRTWVPEQISPTSQPQERQDFRSWVPDQLGGGHIDMEEPAPVNVKAGASASHRGFSPSAYNKVSKTDAGLNSEMAAADAQASTREQAYAETAMAPHEGQVQATQGLAQAAVDKIHAEGEQALVLRRLQDEFAVEEAKANMEAQAQANQAKQDYLVALADFRAQRVDPAQLWKNMTGGERFGTLATAFVHDFLGARGINTSAMATLNKAIDRNIESQVHAIKTKGEVAEGFKSLWWMQRNQSASDAEARTRVRGFLLEGAKQQVIANMAQYESALASAQGRAAITEIDKELSKTLIDIYKHTDANALALRNQALDKWKTKIQASLEQQSLSLQRQRLELEKAKQGQGTSIEPLYDPETGKALWYFQPWVTDKEKEGVRERFSGLTEVADKFEQLRELARQAESISDVEARTRLQDTVQAQFDALATDIAHSAAKANGERATDADVKDFRKWTPQKTWLTMADVDRVIAYAKETKLRSAMAKIRTYTFDMPTELQDTFGQSGSNKPFEAATIEANRSAKPLVEAAHDTQRKQAVGNTQGPQRLGNVDPEEVTIEIKKAHEEAVRQYPHLFSDRKTNYSGPLPGMNQMTSAGSDTVQEFERGMVHLRNMAQRGDSAALEQLKQAAMPYLTGVDTESPEAAFATMLLNEVTPLPDREY